MIDDKDKQSIPECGSNGLPKRHACGLRPITPAHCLRHASLNSTYFSIHREASRSKGSLLRSYPFREHNPSYSRQTEGHYGISSRYSIKRPSPTSPKTETTLFLARYSSALGSAASSNAESTANSEATSAGNGSVACGSFLSCFCRRAEPPESPTKVTVPEITPPRPITTLPAALPTVCLVTLIPIKPRNFFKAGYQAVFVSV